MLIWALFAGMTAVAVLFVLMPVLRRAGATAPDVEAGEVAVYRDQLAEIDRDLEAGLVGPTEAEAARAEISRRILRAGKTAPVAATGARSRLLPALTILAVPIVALGLYARLGHPGLPDMPLSERRTVAAEHGGQTIEELVAKVEAHLASEPGDVRGWDAIAPVYMRIGRLDRAVEAWRTAIRLDGANERRQIGLGQSLFFMADGVVTDEARVAFQKAIEVAPDTVLPRMYLALALTPEGKKAEAVEAWRALVAMGKPGDDWLDDARGELAKAEADLAGKPLETPPPAAAGPGPSAADVEAAAQMSPEERAKMIETMVGRLEERLGAQGGTIDDWERLIRAQKMLGRLAAAAATIERARATFAGDAAAVARIDALTTGLKP